MSDLWRTLKIGDRIRVVEWPKELSEERMHQDTHDVYRWLIDTGGVLTIVKIDEWGLPQGEIRRVIDGEMQWEFLLLNHSGLELGAGTEA